MSFRLVLLVLFFGILPTNVWAADATASLLIRHQQFEPQQLMLPPATKVKLIIRNDDAMPAEFESYDLSREVIVPAHGQVTVYIDPLKPGRYEFFNDFNPAMKGQVIVVKPAPAQGN